MNKSLSDSFFSGNSGRKWRRIKKWLLSQIKVCQRCEETEGLIVHHVVPRWWLLENDGDVFDVDNLEVLCESCHQKADNRWRSDKSYGKPPGQRKGYNHQHKEKSEMNKQILTDRVDIAIAIALDEAVEFSFDETEEYDSEDEDYKNVKEAYQSGFFMGCAAGLDQARKLINQ